MTAPTTLWLRRLVSPGRPQAPDRGGVRPLLDHVRLRNVSAAGVSQRLQARRSPNKNVYRTNSHLRVRRRRTSVLACGDALSHISD
jgi:hypothetical protein